MNAGEEAPSLTMHFEILSHPPVDGYVHVVLWDADGIAKLPEMHRDACYECPRRIDVTLAGTDSHDRAMLHAWADAVSTGLEVGLPIDAYLNDSERARFEPAGGLMVDGLALELEGRRRNASSILDAVVAVLRDLKSRNWKRRSSP